VIAKDKTDKKNM